MYRSNVCGLHTFVVAVDLWAADFRRLLSARSSPEKSMKSFVTCRMMKRGHISLALYAKIAAETYQVLEKQIVEHLDVSLLCLLLVFVQLLPKSVSGSHIQHLVCIDFPSVAAKENMIRVFISKFKNVL